MSQAEQIDQDGRSPLHTAAHADRSGEVSELIASGADINLRDGTGLAPLHLAAQEHAVGAARVLLDAGATVDLPDGQGNTPLFVAVFNSSGSSEMVKLLRDHGADPNTPNKHGQTPHRLAELIDNYDVARFFHD